MPNPKVLVFDIETFPIEAQVWDIWEQNVGLNQITQDWTIAAWSAKWLDAPASEVMYKDNRKAKNVRDDKKLIKPLWKLLNEADIVVTQNGKKFDSKKLNTRFILNGMNPPSPYRHLDTLVIAKKNFAFTSNKLEYIATSLNAKYLKLQHAEYPGHMLWKECLKGNLKAWNAMQKYNIHDVLSTEEAFKRMQPWDSTIDFNVYEDFNTSKCTCGSTKFESRGFTYTTNGKFRRFKCKQCGKWSAARQNLLTVTQRKMLMKSAGAH
jgi:DNA polymerase elongation subunit (family B)